MANQSRMEYKSIKSLKSKAGNETKLVNLKWLDKWLERFTSAVSDYSLSLSPRILLMFELCMSGKAWRIFLLSSLAQTIKAFMGRLMCGSMLPRPRASLKIRESDTLGLPREGKQGVTVSVGIHILICTHQMRLKCSVGCNFIHWESIGSWKMEWSNIKCELAVEIDDKNTIKIMGK